MSSLVKQSQIDGLSQAALFRNFTVWWIDPINGDDANIGAGDNESPSVPVPPIKTFAEVLRRYSFQPVNMGGSNKAEADDFCPFIFNILNPMTTDDAINFQVIAKLFPAAVMAFIGKRVTLATGTITTYTALSGTAGAQHKPSMTSAAISSFNAFINKRIRITSGPRKNLTSTILTGGATPIIAPPCLVSYYYPIDGDNDPFALVSTGLTVPGNFVAGDPFVIEDLPDVYINGPLALSSNTQNIQTVFTAVVFQDCHFPATEGDNVQFSCGQAFFLSLAGCTFDEALLMNQGKLITAGCNFGNGVFLIGLEFANINGGVVNSKPGAFQQTSIFSNCPVVLSANVMFWHGGCVGNQLGIGDACFFDTQVFTSNPNGIAITIATEPGFDLGGGQLNIKRYSGTGQGLCGDGNAGIGILAGPGAKIIYDPAFPRTITGVGGDFQVGDSGSLAVLNPTTGLIMAPIAQSWVNLAAARPLGFGGDFFNLKNLAGMFQKTVIN